MSVNASSTSNDLQVYQCYKSVINYYILRSFTTSRIILLLPLSTLVLYLGHQRWRQQGSLKQASHSDVFTFHMASMELIGIFGFFLYFCGEATDLSAVSKVAQCVHSIGFYGEIFFPLLTCVERYLAVVHPVTYLGLRNARGVRIRNISIGCVWLLCFVMIAVPYLFLLEYTTIPKFCILVFSIVVISFCSLSVLCALIGSGPGDGGKGMKRVSQSKRRAFHTITAISGVVWLWFVGLLVVYSLSESFELSDIVSCAVVVSINWFNLPNSLVSPLLYLHKAGKLSCGC